MTVFKFVNLTENDLSVDPYQGNSGFILKAGSSQDRDFLPPDIITYVRNGLVSSIPPIPTYTTDSSTYISLESALIPSLPYQGDGVHIYGSDNKQWFWTGVTYSNATAATPPDATGSVSGVVRLAGDLSGTAAAPSVPALTSKQPNIQFLNAGIPLGAGGTVTSLNVTGNVLSLVRVGNAITLEGTVSGVTKADVGLGNVDNTSDVNKPVSTAQAAADSAVASTAAASLSAHTTSTSNPHGVTKAQVGLGNVDNTSDVNKPVSTAQAAADSAVASTAAASLSAHTSNSSNPHGVTKAQVGLGNVDNTSDVNKPVSTAQAAADSAVASAAASALSTHATNTGNPHSVTKAQVGLGNVDNTSDVNKPVSTAQNLADIAARDAAISSAAAAVTAQKGVAGGLGSLDGFGQIPLTQLGNAPVGGSSSVTIQFAGTALTLNAANKATYQNALIEFTSATAVTVTLDVSFHPAQVTYRQAGSGIVSTAVSGGAIVNGDAATTIGPGAFVVLVPSYLTGQWTCLADKSSPAPTSWTPYTVTNSYGVYKIELPPVATTLVHPDTGNVGWATVHGNGETRTAMTLAGETSFTASISGSVMTVTAVGLATNPNGSTLAGLLQTGHYISGNGAPAGIYILSRGTGTGLTGTYNLNSSGATGLSGTFLASHRVGVGGVWDRYLDTFSGDGLSEGSRYCWRSTVNPTHIVTNGRPRANIQSHSLDLYRWYRFEFSLRLHQHDSQGWSTDTVPIVQTGVGGITQDAGDYGAGQNVTSGPLGLVIRGSRLYALIRGIEAGMGSVDQGGYVNWDTGDQVFINENWPSQVMSGLKYHEISMEFFLDPRAIRDGGQGQITVTFDRKPWFTWRGPTCYPNSQTTLTPGTVQVWAGQYETSAGPLSAGTLISAVPSCTIERSINYRFLRLMIGK